MGKYEELERKAQQLKALRTNSIPYKAKVKRAASQHPFRRGDLTELSLHPGSSRSPVLDAIKAIAAEHTGCRVATAPEHQRLKYSSRNANTTQGNYGSSHVE